MLFRPVEAGDLQTVATWLAVDENRQWLDFGRGESILTTASLAMMRQRDLHCFRVFSAIDDDELAGIVALSNISQQFGSAYLWYVLGDKSKAGRGLTSRAVNGILAVGFRELGLESVNAWAVEVNKASMRVLEKNGFTLIGRQRRCHRIGDKLYDRLLYDLLPGELTEL